MDRSRKSTDSDGQSVPIIPTVNITLKRTAKGFGFNIVGGTDVPHIPGHPGIYISRIRADSAAAECNKLNVGDRILSVNGIDLSNKTHDEAAEVIRNVQDECNLILETDAERILLSQPSNLIMSRACTSPTNTARSFTRRSKNNTDSRDNSRANSPAARSPVNHDHVKTAVEGSQLSTKVELSSPHSSEKEKPNGVHNPVDKTVKPNGKILIPLDPSPSTLSPSISKQLDPSSLADVVATARKSTSTKSLNSAIPVPRVNKPTPEPSPTPSPSQQRNPTLKDRVPSPARSGVRSRTVSNSSSAAPTLITYHHNSRTLNQPQDDEDDRASTISCAPSTHSVIDDVPRTPKRPISILDPASPSILTEVLFVSIGAIALGVGLLFGYRYWKRR